MQKSCIPTIIAVYFHFKLVRLHLERTSKKTDRATISRIIRVVLNINPPSRWHLSVFAWREIPKFSPSTILRSSRTLSSRVAAFSAHTFLPLRLSSSQTFFHFLSFFSLHVGEYAGRRRNLGICPCIWRTKFSQDPPRHEPPVLGRKGSACTECVNLGKSTVHYAITLKM